jgi:hypothetical protein
MGPGGSNNCYFSWALLRGSTIIFDGTVQTGNFGSTDFRGFAGTTYIDSPATTSATTYKVQFASNFASQVFINSSAGSSSITAIEVGP